ncbi:transcriptional regulator, GntR family [Micromonospora rhizosphaerae]|uniref:Transcriptional regulator, GntR family n=1 Tax=Micromonospora rhizosphaerae TaxID=568872 RepID=A0A1C6SAH2_9ACTN|nr:GntR family transcriptional regulator [Micromonospora rhizosphaerae]SCL26497.1 transcriptional regulator, GntR family [Micromonospora rhizosphaerae]
MESTQRKRAAKAPRTSDQAAPRTRGRSASAAEADLARYLRDAPSWGGTTDAVTNALREAILDGALQPSAWLREDELARTLQVSRTPVREALRRLADEGLVIKTAHQGTVVASLSLEDILALYVVRENLEGVAGRLAAVRCTPELLAGLEASQERLSLAVADGDTAELARENLEFHRLLRTAAGNPYLERFLTQVEHAVRRLPVSTFAKQGRPQAVLAEHQAIIDAIRARDGDAAEAAAKKHMHEARNVRLALVLGS